MEIKLLHMRLENFKHYKSFEIDFSNSTRVTGHNGVGKSSIAAAYMWLFLNIDYDLKSNPDIRRKIEGNPVNDVPVSVEATLEIDGVVVTAKKVQKRSFKKDGSYTDDNSYFINDVPKTLRDFNVYFDFDMGLFKLCTNINAFLDQKPAEMREFLFGLIEDVSDLDVARQFEELAELVPLLEKYTVEELTAMNKASIKKIKSQQDGIPAAIAENKRYLVDNIDTAELELQKNALEERLADVQKQRDDAGETYKAVADLQDEILKTKLEISGAEQEAVEELDKRRREATRLHSDLQSHGYDLFNQRKRKEEELKQLRSLVEKKEKERADLVEQWRAVKAMVMDESETICRYCGQVLPADRIEQIRTDFEKNKAESLDYVTQKGNATKQQIDTTNDLIAKLEAEIADLKQQWDDNSGETAKAYEAMGAIPTEPDLSANQEYTALQDKLRTLESQLGSMDSGESLKKRLSVLERGIREELDGVKEKLLSAAKNIEYEERIAELEEGRKELEQKKPTARKFPTCSISLMRKRILFWAIKSIATSSL